MAPVAIVLRCAYHIDMDVSRQRSEAPAERGARARTRRLMLAVATRLMQDGLVPSVSEVAAAADVSRATAYRYFPSQAALVEAVVDEALGPILDWHSPAKDVRARVNDLLVGSIPRIEAFEATFRAALRHAIDQRPQMTEGEAGADAPFKRGHRVKLLSEAVTRSSAGLPEEDAGRLIRALSLLFGVEALIVLKDIWGADSAEAREVIVWAADALVEAAVSQAGGCKE